MDFYVIETGGKQYKVTAGQALQIEKLSGEPGNSLVFDKVLLSVKGDKVAVGTPYLEGVKVSGQVIEQGRDRKKIIFKFHSKTRQHRTKGHRQPYTKVKVG